MRMPGVSQRSAIAGAAMRGEERLWYFAVTGLVLFAIGGVLAAAFYRGGWWDEYATIYFTNNSIPLGAAWAKLWPTDTNPPFFYFIARLWLDLTGPALFERRLVNAVALAFFLAWLISAARRRPWHRPFLSGLALFAFSGHFFIWYFPEYRGYFWQYCAAIVFLGSASIGYLDRDDDPHVFQMIALFVLITFHEMTAIYTAFILLPLLAVEVYRRRYRRVIWPILVVSVGFLLLLPFIWLQSHQFKSIVTQVSWILPTAPITAIREIAAFLFDDIGRNRAACFAACLILFIPACRPDRPTASLMLIIAGAACASTIFVLILNHHHPLVVERYFCFLAVELIVFLALLIGPSLLSQPLFAALVIGSAAIYLGHGCTAMARDGRMLGDARTVARIVSQCPATRVHALIWLPANSGSVDPTYRLSIGEDQVAVKSLAAIYHIKLLPVVPDDPLTCPVIYWAALRTTAIEQYEHDDDAIRAVDDALGGGLSKTALAHAKLVDTYLHMSSILVVAPTAIRLSERNGGG
jgi:hypothetical protein